MANGFTQRNQRGDDQEERLRTDIMSDYNEFESINREAEGIIGGTKKLTSKVEGMRTMAKDVLRMNLEPERLAELSADRTRRRSLVSGSISDGCSPIDMPGHGGRLNC